MNLVRPSYENNYDLFDPLKFRTNINIDYANVDILKENLKSMLIIRYAEEKIAQMVINNIIKCPCHLGIGQEAIAVGVSSVLKKTDSVFGAHRSHSHFLALNNNVFELFAETLGRIDGCSKGMGGSMHLIDTQNGFYGSVPIVGATIPIAVGAGFAHKMDNKQGISVSYLGDGATEEGGFHESLNLAKVNNLPVLFVVENNLFASHMHILERQPDLSTLRYAKAHNVESLQVDGNDISAVVNAARIASDYLRNGNGPFMIECITYRWKGHVGPSDDNDVGLQRSEVLIEWKKRDPILRLSEGMIQNSILSHDELNSIEMSIRELIDSSWEKAVNSPFPKLDLLHQTVYSKYI